MRTFLALAVLLSSAQVLARGATFDACFFTDEGCYGTTVFDGSIGDPVPTEDTDASDDFQECAYRCDSTWETCQAYAHSALYQCYDYVNAVCDYQLNHDTGESCDYDVAYDGCYDTYALDYAFCYDNHTECEAGCYR